MRFGRVELNILTSHVRYYPICVFLVEARGCLLIALRIARGLFLDFGGNMVLTK